MSIRIAQRYYRELNKLVIEDSKATQTAFLAEIVPQIHTQRKVLGNSHLSVNDAADNVLRILQRLRATATQDIFSEERVRTLATTFVVAVNRRQMNQFASTAMSVTGIDPTKTEVWLRSFMKTAIEENVSYIKTIPVEYHNKIETIVNQGLTRGTSVTEIGKAISVEGHVSQARGEFIARDQLGSIHGDLTRMRQMNAGLESFIWMTASDGRVRESHASFHGKTFTWKDGAINERGERVWPGTDYNCRCYAEPVKEELEDMLGKKGR